MSAIFGIINKNEKVVEPGTIQKMNSALQHRAKDGNRIIKTTNAAFGYFNLAASQNDNNCQLPIEDDEFIFTGNVHLHNRSELINKLNLDIKEYATLHDGYLILAAYKKWGGECVNYFDGEYVYALWNKKSNQLFISNDHIGYKPLFYYETCDQFIFCSELKGIEAVKETPNYFDSSSVTQYLFFYLSNASATLNTEIKYLCGGSILKVERGSTSLYKYWKLSSGHYNFKKDSDWYDCLQEKIINAVENRMYDNNLVGISLSGGLDSASIACILSNILKKKNKCLYAFSSALPNNYSGEAKDERFYIDIINKHCGNIVQTYVSAENGNPYINIEKAIEQDEVIPNYFHYMDTAILKSAQEKNISLLYTGFGGDYWVSAQGHKVIYKMVNRLRLSEAYRLIKLMSATYGKNHFEVFKLQYVMYTKLHKKYWQNKWNFSKNFTKSYLRSIKYNEEVHDIAHMPEIINSGKIGRLLGLIDNRNEMFGISSAAPLFDKNIMQLMCDIPDRLYIEGGIQRNLFREALKGILPDEIRLRLTKSPYVPDYRERIKNSDHVKNEELIKYEIKTLSHILETGKTLKFVTNDKEKMNKMVDIHLLRNCQLISLAKITRYLKSKNYIFDFKH